MTRHDGFMEKSQGHKYKRVQNPMRRYKMVSSKPKDVVMNQPPAYQKVIVPDRNRQSCESATPYTQYYRIPSLKSACRASTIDVWVLCLRRPIVRTIILSLAVNTLPGRT